MKPTRLLRAVLLCAAIALPNAAPAHNDASAKHGGIVRNAGDLHFELVARGGDTIVYVEDHGKPVPTADMGGKLTVLTGKETSEAPLAPAGENRLVAKGVKLASGAKVVASITRDGKTISVRFAIR